MLRNIAPWAFAIALAVFCSVGTAQDPTWRLTGNSGVRVDADFLGTTDNAPLIIKTNGVEAMRITPGGTTKFGNVELPSSGNVLIGGSVGFSSSLTPKLDVVGTAKVQELDVRGTAKVQILQITGGVDFAERFPVDDSEVEPGTIMIIDEAHPGSLRISDTPYDVRVAGVVSGAGGLTPGLLLQTTAATRDPLIALGGRVYCKGEALHHAIRAGDLLTTSSLKGHAMKASNDRISRGAILGKAMTELKEGTGLVLVLVDLQ